MPDKYCTTSDVFRVAPELQDDFRLGNASDNSRLNELIEEATLSAKASLQGRYDLNQFDGTQPETIAYSVRTLTAVMVSQIAIERFGGGNDADPRLRAIRARVDRFKSLTRQGSLPGLVPSYNPSPGPAPDDQSKSIEEVNNVNYASYALNLN